MSDLNKAILKVAQTNPEFAKALVAELKMEPGVTKQSSNADMVRDLKRQRGVFVTWWPRNGEAQIWKLPNGSFSVFKSVGWDTQQQSAKNLQDARKAAVEIVASFKSR